jgi:hypothetical protein
MAAKARTRSAGKAQVRHKHLKLDQKKIAFAVRYFGAKSEQEAIDRALALLMQERELTGSMRALHGVLKEDKQPWPYR